MNGPIQSLNPILVVEICPHYRQYLRRSYKVGERSDLLLRISDVVFTPPKLVAQHAREFFQYGAGACKVQNLQRRAAKVQRGDCRCYTQPQFLTGDRFASLPWEQLLFNGGETRLIPAPRRSHPVPPGTNK